MTLSPEVQARFGQIRRELRRSLPAPIRRRNQAIVEHLGLAHHVAGRQIQRGQGEWDDLVQEASLGLIDAIERFDASLGHRLSTYAVACANGRILHFRRDRQSTIRIPWRLRALHGRGMRLQEQQGHQPGAALSEAALIAALGVSRERWRQAVQAHWQSVVLSFDLPCSDDPEAMAELITGVEGLTSATGVDGDPQRDWLHEALLRLQPQQRRWLLAHWVDGVPLRVLAQREGVHPAMLRRVLTTALEQLRHLAQVCSDQHRPMPMASSAATAV